MFDHSFAIDHFFAKTLMKNLEDENLYVFLCYLMYLSRNGHLCVKVEDHAIYPDEIADSCFREKIIRGFHNLPHHLCAKSMQEVNKPLIKHKNLVYLQKNWMFETKIVEKTQEFFDTSPDQNIDLSLGYSLLNTNKLFPEQQKAVEHVFQHRLTILCGGPGTGKSYTASKLIEIFSEISANSFEITVAAISGKAVSYLEQKIHPNLSFQAKTLHSLLNLSSWKNISFDELLISADLLIVDEASMIDVKIFAYLFAALKKGARLVLIGDPNQLPPVESGTVFADLAKKGSIDLKQNVRVKNPVLHHFANDILSSNFDKCMHYIEEKTISFFNFDFVRDLSFSYLDHFVVSVQKHTDIHEIYETLQNFRILSCIRQGPFGVDALNEALFQYYMQKNKKDCFLAIPIVITKNDYQLELYNGMTGILLIHEQEKTIYIRIRGEMKEFSPYILPHYEYGFVLSIHKSQGSEFKDVLVIVPPGSENFGKEILYTAITRAKENLKIIGSLPIIQHLILKEGKKYSGILDRLS